MAVRKVTYRVGKYPPPHIPVIPDKKTIMAIKSIHSGTANEIQQKLFIEFLIHDLCGAYDVGYHSGKIDDTAFAAGKRFVALNLRDLINFDVDKLKERV
jgi:hypothetical protein